MRTVGSIVAAEVLTEGTDNHALVPMLQQVQDHVGAVAQQTVADAGYFSGEQLERAERQGCAVLVPESEERKAAAKRAVQRGAVCVRRGTRLLPLSTGAGAAV